VSIRLQPLRRDPSLKERAYEIIKRHVLQNLDAGEPLLVHEMAEQLGISRTPVREALLALEQEGFVETIPHKGTFVVRLSVDEIKKIYEVRQVLECLAVRLAVGSIPVDYLLALKSQLEIAREALRGGDDEAHFNVDTDLHSLIAGHCGNEFLQRIIENLGERVYRIRAYSRRRSGEHLRQSLEEHVQIVDALLQGDRELAEQRMGAHIVRSGERIAALMGQQQEQEVYQEAHQ